MITTNSTGSLARVTIGKEDIRTHKAKLAMIENGFVRAYARALNRTIAGVKTDMVHLARTDYTFKAKALRSRLSDSKASWYRLQAYVKSKGHAVLLTDFAGTRQTKKGLSVNIKKSTGRQIIEHAFANYARSAKLVSMWREKKGGKRVPRYPVEGLYGPHPEVLYHAPENWAVLQEKAGVRLSKNMAHEVDYVLSRYA